MMWILIALVGIAIYIEATVQSNNFRNENRR